MHKHLIFAKKLIILAKQIVEADSFASQDLGNLILDTLDKASPEDLKKYEFLQKLSADDFSSLAQDHNMIKTILDKASSKIGTKTSTQIPIMKTPVTAPQTMPRAQPKTMPVFKG